MKKSLVAALACALLAVPGIAAAEPLVTVEDPTPTGTFTGTYQCGWETYVDENGDTQYTLDEDGNRIPVYCDETGYVSVGTDGVVACNGNEEITRPDDGTALQGYIWIGPGQAASNPTAAAPGNAAGAGNNHEDADGEPTGESPCP